MGENHSSLLGTSAGRSDSVTTAGRALLWHGGLMTLLGLLSGFGPLFFPNVPGNPHLIGVVQGALLCGLAGAWHLLRASAWVLRALKYSLLIGLYGNWAGAQLKAFTGTDLAPGGGATLMDVALGIQSTSLLVLVTCISILWASRRGPVAAR